MTESDLHWLRLPAPTPVQTRPRSLVLPMRDGVRLAVDVYLPPALRGRVPTLVRQTRYMRALTARFGASWSLSQFDLYARTRAVFLAAGYAWVDVDVRGTGASSGSWICPWSPDEVEDGVEVVDWIVEQPWSNGRAGSLGISYDGTAADMLVTKQHRAVRAVAPMFALYDVYAEVALPGGIPLSWFIERWGAYNARLDQGRFPEAIAIAMTVMGLAAREAPRPRPLERLLGMLASRGEEEGRRRAARVVARLVAGVRPAGGEPADTEGRLENMDVFAALQNIAFRDDSGVLPQMPEGTIDWMSPHTFRRGAQASGAAIYSYSGWRDGAYPHGAIKRFSSVRTPGSRLTLGPWIHTGRLRVPAFDLAAESLFDHDAELLSFFDEHVRGELPRGDGSPVHYFTMGEGWKAASTWPPPGTAPLTLYLAKDRALSRARSPEESAMEIVEDGTRGSGLRARWRSLLSLTPGDYPDRAERDRKLLVFESEPLDEDTEVTGHPVAVLFLSCSHDDGDVFVYLEDASPDGRVAYVTEGQLRISQRRRAHDPRPYETPAPLHAFTRELAAPVRPGEVVRLDVDLLPVSWLFRRGHRVRLAFAGADADHFQVMAPRTLSLRAGPDHPSNLELPVMRRGPLQSG